MGGGGGGGVQGSSPHTRGARRRTPLDRHPGGIIPAYAGSTLEAGTDGAVLGGSSPHTRGAPPGLVRGEGFRGDHPRIRGEHVFLSSLGGLSPGSSPHTRGAPRGARGRFWLWRIIPAYAGSTNRDRHGRRRPADHPRIRGEHGWGGHVDPSGQGSSPHTRGAPENRTQDPSGGRIIPAYAGSTRPGSGRTVGPWDHPRIRGEHRALCPDRPRARGSSPHTRGARRARWRRVRGRRIIPAYAGSTTIKAFPGFGRGDHPRIRGEHSGQGQIAVGFDGSSPHTRGARGTLPASRAGPRIIPAYAGSTERPSASHRRWRDHPRIRGEHPAARRPSPPKRGSSPHTRGAR